jgi:tyrosinase
MSTTRRQVLLQGGAIGAGIIASNLPAMTALAQGQLPQRRALDGLAWNDPIVATYRDAVGIMKKMPPSQQFSWVNLAMIHGTDPDTYHYCPHGNWYFLPWHRAFTAMYERIVRQLTNNNDFALPYWDWTANPLMPDVFLTPKTPDGKPNPLYNSDAGWQRTWPSNQPMPAETVGPTVLNAILSATEYEQFGTSRPEGQNSLDASWITTGSGTQDQLEGNAHNMVHNNIGGWMPSASSPRDPIFFMHHCNIDRIWALWNVQNPNSSDQLWTDMPFTENFYSVDGSFWSPKVSDLYVPENLGYTYGLSTPSLVAAAPPSPKVLALRNKLTTLFAAPKLTGVNAAGITTAVATNTLAATPSRPLDIAVTVPAEALVAVARGTPVGSGAESMNFAAAQEQSASGTRALAFLRDVMVTNPHTTMYRVFIDRNNLSASTPITDPNYVGTFGIFHNNTHAGHNAMPSFVLDLTAAIRRVYGSGKTPTGRIRIQIMPVPNGSGRVTAGTAKPTRVEVAFVTT